MEPRQAKKILIVDDEKDTVEMITALLELEGYQVLSALSGSEAMKILAVESQKVPEPETPVDLILLDILLGDADGRDICLKIKEDEKLKFIPVIILTVRSSLQDKINSLNRGADDYLTKPFVNEELLARVRVMLRIKDLHDELKREQDKNILLTQVLEKRYSFDNIFGKNARMQEVFELISDIADTDSTVLIQGESGTGKELIARAIHFNSHRKTKPFVVANCSAYSQNLLESELFGHEKGSFTGAIRRKIGRFEMANGGTIFLDEIGEVSPPTQILLLRVLQDHRFERVGGEETLEVDVRVIAATNKNLTEEMKKGTFREDLYYRLNVIPIFVPPFVIEKTISPLWPLIPCKDSAVSGGKRSPVFLLKSWRFSSPTPGLEMCGNWRMSLNMRSSLPSRIRYYQKTSLNTFSKGLWPCKNSLPFKITKKTSF